LKDLCALSKNSMRYTLTLLLAIALVAPLSFSDASSHNSCTPEYRSNMWYTGGTSVPLAFEGLSAPMDCSQFLTGTVYSHWNRSVEYVPGEHDPYRTLCIGLINPTGSETKNETTSGGTGPNPSTTSYSSGRVCPATVLTASLVANPTSIISGEQSLLTWASQGATSCAGTNFPTGGATSGSLTVSPTVTTPYTVTCTNGVTSATASVFQGAMQCSGGTQVARGNDIQDGVHFGSGYNSEPWCDENTPVGGCCNVEVREVVDSTGHPVNTYYFFKAYTGATLVQKDSYRTDLSNTNHNFFAWLNTSSGSAGNSASASATVTVSSSALTVSCQPSPTTGTVGQTITWGSTVSGCTTVGTWSYSSSDTIDLACSGVGSSGVGFVTNPNLPLSGMQNCPANPEGKTCTASCKIQTVNGCFINTDIYACTGVVNSCTYSWTGTDGLSGITASIQKIYSTIGTKTASLAVTSGGSSVSTVCNGLSCSSPNCDGGAGAGDGGVIITAVAQCSDTADNDGDAKADTLDPGCHTDANPSNTASYDPSDNDERNTQCSDGIDNDGNGKTDYKADGTGDVGCTSLTDNDESSNARLSLSLSANASLVQYGSTATLSWSAINVQSGTCRITGTNGTDYTFDSGTLGGTSGSVTTTGKPLTSQVTFTLSCKNLAGTTVSTTAIVRVTPRSGEF